ncbi:DDE-type integrase/transposase/recombinase [Halarchaeum salinum]|uniref:IS6-like element ISH29 family transposase n=1 Tax=Halarchaeum salinum TaxID=489912 RepID=A0AAV3S3J1_9EURY
MPEISRLSGGSDCFELAFVEREATPNWAMKLGIRLHLAGLSPSNTVSELDRFGVDRARSTVHNWVQKADLQPSGGKNSDHVAVDETVIQINGQQYWLYDAVDPNTNKFLHVKLGTAQNRGLSELFFGELREKYDVEDVPRNQGFLVCERDVLRLVNAVFLDDGAPWLQEALRRHGLRFQHVTHGNRNAVERLYKEIKRRTNQFANHFRHADPATAETWLLAQAFCQNQLI